MGCAPRLLHRRARDYDFLERVFQKLLLNFTWWLNREDPEGNNVFAGGFLGLDNISPIDRSHLPPGVELDQVDGTAWMAFYSLSMLGTAVVLARHDPVYDDMVVKFLEQFAMIGRAINSQGLYDPDDGFFYDRLRLPNGQSRRVEVQNIGGAVPLFSAVQVHGEMTERGQALGKRFARILARENVDQSALVALGRIRDDEHGRRVLLSVVTPDQLRVTLRDLFDEAAFLSPYGLRAVSKRLENNPYVVDVEGGTYAVDYEPAESTTPMYGGNSNWRGPIWFPMNYLVIRSLARFHLYLGDEFRIEYPTGSGQSHTLLEIAQDLSDRLVAIFLPGPDGRRPVFGGTARFQTDPAWKDNLLFNEYFHGDNGAGLGASHQTGWTGLVADLILEPPSRMLLAAQFEAHV